MTALRDRDVATPRFQAQLLILFAAIAVFLAAVGVAGVMGYNVTQRRSEIGVRMALGAERGDVLRMIVGEGMRLVALGLVFGLAGAVAGAQLLRGMLFGVSPGDLPTYVAVPIVLAAVAFLAILLPAMRASRVHPMEALRDE